MAKSAKRKIRRNVSKAMVHVKATFNNTLITITDMNGDVICRDSGGTVGFKGNLFLFFTEMVLNTSDPLKELKRAISSDQMLKTAFSLKELSKLKRK